MQGSDLVSSVYLLLLLGLDELMVQSAVAAGEVVQHPPEPPVLLAGLPELPLHRRRLRTRQHV
jgi:hypothetical protein